MELEQVEDINLHKISELQDRFLALKPTSTGHALRKKLSLSSLTEISKKYSVLNLAQNLTKKPPKKKKLAKISANDAFDLNEANKGHTAYAREVIKETKKMQQPPISYHFAEGVGNPKQEKQNFSHKAEIPEENLQLKKDVKHKNILDRAKRFISIFRTKCK